MILQCRISNPVHYHRRLNTTLMKTSPHCLLIALAWFIATTNLHAQVTFTISSSPTVNPGQLPYSVVAADIDRDGNLDLVSANAGTFPGIISVLTNNASGFFAVKATFLVGAGPRSITAADVNGDDKVDLICANSATNTLSVLTNRGNVGTGFVLMGTLQVGKNPYSVVAADVNSDGKMDLITGNAGASPNLIGTLTVLTNSDGGNFGSNATLNVGIGPRSVVAADINGDGKVDLISANSGDGILPDSLSVLTNDGGGGFLLASTNAATFPQSVTTGDVNGDGKPDLICTHNGSALVVLTNNTGGKFEPASTNSVGNDPRSIAAADVNGDGKLDLISGNAGDDTCSVLTNDGSGGFALAVLPGVGSGPNSVIAADVNRDGKADLISANRVASTLSVLFNTTIFPPRLLKINRSSNSVIVSWPSFWNGWNLQQNSNLLTTNWSDSAGISDDGTNKSLTITSPTGNNYFRLSYF
jgi:hypothetical protein